MSRHIHRLAFSFPLMVLTALAAPTGLPVAEAADGAAAFEFGDVVEVERFGQWRTGKVIQVLPGGSLRVMLEDETFARVYPPNKYRVLPGAKKPKQSPAASDDDNPFATEEEKRAADEPRTWTDRSGQFEVVAKLLRVDGESVVLRRDDGKEITVPLAKLSDADRRFVQGPQSAQVVEDKPVEFTPTNLNQARPVDVSASSQWDYRPDPGPKPDATETHPVRIALGSRVDFFDVPVDLFVLPEAQQAFAVWLNEHPGRAHVSRVFACDLSKKKVGGAGAFPPAQVPLAVTGDLNWVIAGDARFGFGENGTLYLHALQGQQVIPKAMWQPYQHDDGLHGDVVWVALVQDDALLTMNHGGQLALWRIPEIEPIWVARGKGDTRPGLSGGKRIVALPVSDGVVLLEALTGKKLGHLPADMSGSGACRTAIDPPGERLALFCRRRCRVWQLDTRELVRDFPLPGNVMGEQLDWVGPEHLLVGGRHVVDVEHRIWLWEYQKLTAAARVAAGRLWYIAQGLNNDDFVLASASIPDAAAYQVASLQNADDLLVVKPGMTVSIELSLSAAQAERQAILDGLKSRLADGGLEVVEKDGDLKLVGSIRRGTTEDIEYRSFGSFKSTKHKATSQILELAYHVDGEVVWRYTSETHPPHMLHLEKGESIDAALAREMRQDPQHFSRVWLPSHVARCEENQPLGKSAEPAP